MNTPNETPSVRGYLYTSKSLYTVHSPARSIDFISLEESIEHRLTYRVTREKESRICMHLYELDFLERP